MNYLYHWVPKDMRGDILYPLNELKSIYPDLYANHASKYAGRENIMKLHIPVLDCMWNDVLHFSAIHPTHIKQALFDSGSKSQPQIVLFEIDPHLLDPSRTIVFLYNQDDLSKKLDENNFIKFNPDMIANYATLPEATNDYYRKMLNQGIKPLWFHRVPHILYKGSLNASKIKRILV